MTQLPSKTGESDSAPSEPDDSLLASAPKEVQIVAMRRWFLDRYENPDIQTPWDSEKKVYVFVWGGPYDPNDEIQERFGDIVDFDTMRELIEELWLEAGDEWAPIEREGVDYDDYISKLIVIDRNDPYRFLKERIAGIFAILAAANLDKNNTRLLHQMAHSSLVAALEAYLANSVSYWIEKEEKALRQFVTTNKDLQKRQLTLSDIFKRLDGITAEVKTYLADFVWHRLDKVKPMLVSGLEIEVPDISDLMKEVLVRHDIVHRAGRKADGNLVELSTDDLLRLEEAISKFSKGIEDELVRRFPA